MVMADVIPGQNIDDSAHAIMEETPLWAACRLESTSGGSAGGITMRSLWIITASTVYRSL